MVYGYARVSTAEQNLARQEDYFEGKIDRMFEEKRSGKNADRKELKEMLSILQPGDEVIVLELSRLGRSIRDLLNIVDEIKNKGAVFKSVKENIDLSTASGELIFHIMASLAEFERKQILERQAEGIAVAKKSGVKFGRERKYRPKNEEEIFLKLSRGEITFDEAAKEYGSKGSLQYWYKKWKKTA